jgi:phosphate transport system permease protein
MTSKTSNKTSLSQTDTIVTNALMVLALIASSFIIMIAVFITAQGILPLITNNRGLGSVNLWHFLTDTVWLRGDYFVSTVYGAGFLIVNTLYIALLTVLLSFPVGVLTALFIARIAPRPIAAAMRTIIELLASVPSIVFGLVGVGLFLPLIYNLARSLGFNSAGGYSVLGTVFVLALMSIPTITAVAEVSIRQVDESLAQAALALGATPTQANFKIVLLAAKSGIFSGVILAVGRSLGEATAVALVSGNARSGPSFGLFQTTATITSTLLQGLKETVGIDYDIRFTLGILLMIVILLTNAALNFVKRKVGNQDA